MNKSHYESPKETILVVDDSPESLGLVNDTLESAGYNVLVALEGKQALTIARRIRPDMILMDAIMPHKDGFDTCRELQSIPELATIPVIFMTGLTDSGSVVKGLQSGGVDYLTKPIDPDELLARMHVHLSNARRTSSAWSALDSTGQHLFSVKPDGTMHWATPQTLALFARYRGDEQWRSSALAEQLGSWLENHKRELPAPGSSCTISLPGDDNSTLVVTIMEHTSGSEILLRLNEVDDTPDEETLQKTLSLTRRESQVLYWLSNGKTNWEIARILDISPRTVNKHLEQVYRKLEVQNRTAAARIALNTLASV